VQEQDGFIILGIDIRSTGLGFLLGVLSSWLATIIDRYWKHRRQATQFNKTYKDLSGTYVVYRVTDAGEERTNHTVKIIRRSAEIFEAKGLYPCGNVEWSSEIKMNLQPKNTGTGSYHYIEQPREYGIQQIRSLPETRSLHVVGSHTSRGKPFGFVHLWKYKEQ
jgi:hypothetical protein